MKKKKNIGVIIFVSVCIIFTVACIIVQFFIKQDMKELDKEGEKFESMITETANGTEIETQYIHIEDDKFFVKVPKNFIQLDAETINKKYQGDVPNVVFSSEDTKINVAINQTDVAMSNDQVLEYRKEFESIYKNSAEILETDYYEVNEHNVGKIRMVSQAVDTKIYNNSIFFSYEDKLIIVTFNCTEDLRSEWEEVGNFIIDSLFFGDDNDE